jgi:hypothetical protein
MITLKGIGLGGERIHRGDFSFDFTIPAGSGNTITQEITLPRADYKQGFLKLHATNAAPTSRKKMLSWIHFSTASGEANSMSTDVKTYSVYGYLFDAWHLKGYISSVDSQLGEAEWYAFAGIGKSKIIGCVIDGDKLKITWENTNNTYGSRVVAEGTYQLFR